MSERLSILGGRASGKSTWLGCTWLASRQPNSKLRAAGLPEALEPLRILSADLLNRKYPQRTNTSAAGLIRVPFVWQGSLADIAFELEVADFDGEELDSIFQLRQAAWTDAWERRSEPSLGLLLFLRPSQAERVTSTRLQSKEVPDADSPELLFPGQTPVEASPEGTAHIPSEVAIIETIQLMRAARGFGVGERAPERLGIVLSCWDEVPNTQAAEGPDKVFSETYPLLYDFVYTCHDATRVQLFGLSATGANLSDNQVRRALIDGDRQIAELGRLVWRSGRGQPLQDSGHIALPLGWMIEGDAALR